MQADKQQDTKRALNSFFIASQPQAYRMAKAALRDHEQALDIVQDSMLKMTEHYRDKAVEEWPLLFFRIVTNRINDARRFRMLYAGKKLLLSSFRKADNEVTDDDVIDMLAESPSHGSGEQFDTLASQQLNDKLEVAMQKLPMQQRQVFMLREWQGFSIKEAADILGCEIGTIKQHHYRALRALRAELAEYWEYANSEI